MRHPEEFYKFYRDKCFVIQQSRMERIWKLAELESRQAESGDHTEYR